MMESVVKNISELRTKFFEDKTGPVFAGDSYGHWYHVGNKTMRYYFDSSRKDHMVFQEQIKIKDLKNPRRVDVRSVFR